MYDNDFTGFKYDGFHFTIYPHPSEDASKVIKLAHVSDGSRYTDELLPQSQDQTVNVPGGDGTYYFGTNFTGKTFSIDFAFDNLSESDLRKLRVIFSKRNKLAPLIFDENPYKYWMVKCQGMPSIKTICFVENQQLNEPVPLIHTANLMGVPASGAAAEPSEGQPIAGSLPTYNQTTGRRVYKGEGNVVFTAFYPFARCGSNGTSKWENGYSATWDSTKIYAPTINEWIGTAGLKASQGSYDSTSGNVTSIYNPGDMGADFSMIISIVDTSAQPSTYNLIGIRQNGTSMENQPDWGLRTTGLAGLISAAASQHDNYLCYNTRTQLLEGYSYNSSATPPYQPTGNVYNRFIDSTGTNLSCIPLGENKLSVPSSYFGIAKLDYDYVYIG